LDLKALYKSVIIIIIIIIIRTVKEYMYWFTIITVVKRMEEVYQ